MTLKDDVKFEERLTCGLENDPRNLENLPEHSKVSKLGLLWDPFIQSKECMSLKFIEELCVMKSYAKFEEELTCHFKIDMRNLINFDQSTQKSQKLHFNGLLSNKVHNV